MSKEFYKVKFDEGIYAIRCEIWDNEKNENAAIHQVWTIEGDDTVMALDGPEPEVAGLHDFLSKEFSKTIMMVNTHGHIDHIGCNGQFGNVWINQKDWALVCGGGIVPSNDFSKLSTLSYQVHPIKEGDTINLGKREIEIYELPGHTAGSIVLYDKSTKTLFSGDAIARRVLYGISDWTPVVNYLDKLWEVDRLDIKQILSAHDSFPLPPSWPKKIRKIILDYLETEERLWEYPDMNLNFCQIIHGKDENDKAFFDFSLPFARKEETIVELLKIKETEV